MGLRIVDLLKIVTFAQSALVSFVWAAVRGPTAGGYCAQSLKLRFRFMDRGPPS